VKALTSTLRPLHGNKVGAAIEELHRSENDLAGALLSLSDQQKIDHEVSTVARDIARASQETCAASPKWGETTASPWIRLQRMKRRCWRE
jgi:hypothetical protein